MAFHFRLCIPEQYKGVRCVDLGGSFQTHIYLQNFASIQPRTRLVNEERALIPQVILADFVRLEEETSTEEADAQRVSAPGEHVGGPRVGWVQGSPVPFAEEGHVHAGVAQDVPRGRPYGDVGDVETQTAVLRAALAVFEQAKARGHVEHLPFVWPEDPKETKWHPAEPSPIIAMIKKRRETS